MQKASRRRGRGLGSGAPHSRSVNQGGGVKTTSNKKNNYLQLNIEIFFFFPPDDPLAPGACLPPIFSMRFSRHVARAAPAPSSIRIIPLDQVVLAPPPARSSLYLLLPVLALTLLVLGTLFRSLTLSDLHQSMLAVSGGEPPAGGVVQPPGPQQAVPAPGPSLHDMALTFLGGSLSSSPSPSLSPSPSFSPSPSPSGAPMGSEPVYHFSPLPLNPPLPYGIALSNFTGTLGLHMSSHTCVGGYGGSLEAQLRQPGSCGFHNLFCTDPFTGAYPNRTCSFSNLYFARSPSHPPPYSSGDWYYFFPVALEDLANPAWSAAATRQRLQAELRVDLLSRLKQDSWWRVEVLFFLAEPTGKMTAASWARPEPVRREGGALGGLPPVAITHSAAQCTLVDRLTGRNSSQGGGAEVACLPPGVGAFTLRPFFLMFFSHHTNIGHTIWDDLAPFMAAAHTLGLPLQHYDLLLTCIPQDSMYRWSPAEPAASWSAGDQGVRTALAYTSPNRDPVQLGTLGEEAGAVLVHFPAIAGGLTGMSPHNFRPSHVVFGAEEPVRSVWALRVHMMRNMGFSEAEVQRHARDIRPPQPQPETEPQPQPQPLAAATNVSLLFVRGKRGISNLEELMASVRAAYPYISVGSVAWEETGGLLNEARILSATHILLSLDGTASLKNFFLPPGAVFVELGVAQPWGSQMLCDFLHGAYDHIRVLHYDQLGPGEHGGNQLSSLTIPFPKLAPFLNAALGLLRAGFPIPLPQGTNLDGNALLLRHLFARYPELAYYGVDLWTQARLKTVRVFEGAADWYTSAVGRPPPPQFAADIELYCAEHPCGK